MNVESLPELKPNQRVSIKTRTFPEARRYAFIEHMTMRQVKDGPLVPALKLLKLDNQNVTHMVVDCITEITHEDEGS